MSAIKHLHKHTHTHSLFEHFVPGSNIALFDSNACLHPNLFLLLSSASPVIPNRPVVLLTTHLQRKLAQLSAQTGIFQNIRQLQFQLMCVGCRVWGSQGEHWADKQQPLLWLWGGKCSKMTSDTTRVCSWATIIYFSWLSRSYCTNAPPQISNGNKKLEESHGHPCHDREQMPLLAGSFKGNNITGNRFKTQGLNLI